MKKDTLSECGKGMTNINDLHELQSERTQNQDSRKPRGKSDLY